MAMQLNANFSQRVVMHGDRMDWQVSPIAGVERRMLDRIGDEVARATSIVRYAPSSHFPAHVHNGGEEFLVLEGVFQDEHGDYPAGSYIRNPPTTRHTPGSKQGCVIFVKLWQFDRQDRTSVNLDSNKAAAKPDVDRPDVVVTPLFKNEQEDVRIETWQPNATIKVNARNGAELLVMKGSFSEREDTLHYQSWLRVPVGGAVNALAGPDGARVWIKTGHLRFSADYTQPTA